MSQIKVDSIATRSGNKGIRTSKLIDGINSSNETKESLEVSKRVTGFVDRVSSNISYNGFILNLEISNKCLVYKGAAKYEVRENKTIDLTNTHGPQYIKYLPKEDKLQAIGNSPDFLNDVLVAWVYVHPVDGIIWCGDERHSCTRNVEWHRALHLDMGAVWRSGGIATYTLDEEQNTSLGFTSPIFIADEDLEFIISHDNEPSLPYQQVLSGQAELPVLYLDGEYYKVVPASNDPFNSPILVGTRAKYNFTLGGTSGELYEADDDTYIPYYVVGTNDQENPVKLVLGRGAYNTLDEANLEEFDGFGLSIPEIVPMYKVVLHVSDSYGNPAKVVVKSVLKITTRTSSLQNTFVPNTHAGLSGRDEENQHPIEAITGLNTALDSKPDKRNKVIAGTGLTGGGTLEEDRTLTVKYGSEAGTAAQGNDSRIINGQAAYDWGNHASAGYVKTDTTYTAGNGLTLSETTFSLPITVSGSGTYIANVEQTANGITVTKGTPPNTNTTYSAGAGLTLSGTAFSAAITISTGNPSGGSNRSVHYKV